MGPLVFGLCTWLVLQVSHQSPVLDVEKRRANRRMIHEFIEDKLIEHGQALEMILTELRKNEELTTRLIDNLSLRLSPPKLPEKIAPVVPVHPSRRSNEPVTLRPVEIFSNMISRVGNMAKDYIHRLIKGQQEDPIVLVQDN